MENFLCVCVCVGWVHRGMDSWQVLYRGKEREGRGAKKTCRQWWLKGMEVKEVGEKV